MRTVSATEIQQNMAGVRTMANVEPVEITQPNQEPLVLLTMNEYTRLKRRDRRSCALEDLPEWLVDAFAEADMDEQFDDLNRLLD